MLVFLCIWAFTEQPCVKKRSCFSGVSPPPQQTTTRHGSLQKPTEQNTLLRTLTKFTNSQIYQKIQRQFPLISAGSSGNVSWVD
jgi:hypothetical protein